MKRLTRIGVVLLPLFLALIPDACADNVRARILIGSREAIVAPAPVFDGKRVLAPLGIIEVLGASRKSTAGGRVTVQSVLGNSGDIKVVKVDGADMIPVAELVRITGGRAEWDGESKTLKLKALVGPTEFVDGKLKINCSFPVAYSAGDWADKVWVDIPDAVIESEARIISIDGPLVSAARLGQHPDKVRVALDLKKKAGYKFESDPVASTIVLRVSENLPPPDTESDKPGELKPYTIESVQFQSAGASQFQIVFRTSGRAVLAPAFGAAPPQIILSLPGGTLSESAAGFKAQHALLQKATLTQAAGSVPSARLVLDLKRIMTYEIDQDDTTVSLKVSVPVGAGGKLAGKSVVVDPGHGGNQTGARWKDLEEKDLNLQIANRLVAALKKEGVNVRLTRTADSTLGLGERTELAINTGADFFISIHCNSNGQPNSATGIETFYHKREPSPMALAYAVQAAASFSSGMLNRGARSDSVLYSSGLGVLRRLSGTGIPGILLECGYMNHDSDRAKLVDPQYQEKIAAGIVAGFKAYVEGTPIKRN